jgi:hypothetical protein
MSQVSQCYEQLTPSPPPEILTNFRSTGLQLIIIYLAVGNIPRRFELSDQNTRIAGKTVRDERVVWKPGFSDVGGF